MRKTPSPTKQPVKFFSSQSSTSTASEEMFQKIITQDQTALPYQEKKNFVQDVLPDLEIKLVNSYIYAARFIFNTQSRDHDSHSFDYLDKALTITENRKDLQSLHQLAKEIKLSMECEIGRGDQKWASVTDPKELAKLMDIPPESESDQEQEDEQDPNAPCTLTFK